MRALTAFRYWHEAVLVVLLAGLLIYAKCVDPRFVTIDRQVVLSNHAWELALLSLPMLLIIITGGIDLSVGSSLALCAVILGMAFERGVDPIVASALAIVGGTGLGALNGWFVAKVKVHPLIVTLATLAAYRGIAQGISLAKPVTGFPQGFQDLATKTVLGMPLPGLLFVLFWAVVAVVLARTRLGRSIFAIGHNETAARFSGLQVDRIKLLLYALAGSVAGLAAAIQVARFNTAKADMGAGMELDVITAVVFGGTSINGGRGNVVGLLLGVTLIHETREFVGWHWEKTELNAIVIGALLILSVLLHRLLSPRSRAED